MMKNIPVQKTADNQKISVQEIAFPKGGGAIQGIGASFNANLFLGAGTYSIPVPVTKARGFEPQLNISYSSGAGNGVFGLGFSLSLSKVSIKTNKGIPKYDRKDQYELDGDTLVVQKSTSEIPNPRSEQHNGQTCLVTIYLAQIERSFSRIEHWQNSVAGLSFWKVITANNTTSYYGINTKIANPANPFQVFEWLIDNSTDNKGNQIVYTYVAENAINVPDEVYELNRSNTANRYIYKIGYGNYVDSEGKTNFAFEIVFNYGQAPGQQPDTHWTCRKDPFSSYNSGFEIRTHRLCHGIQLTHHFPDELGDPLVVKELGFAYENIQRYTPVLFQGMSMLTKATLTGFRKEPAEPQVLPPLEFGYSAFVPTIAPEFKLLSMGEGSIPGYLNATQFLPVDLNGEGLPGFLISNDSMSIYMEPLGDGKYKLPVPTPSFPVNKNIQGGDSILTDLDGNGQLELVVKNKSDQGYYEQNFDGAWHNFVPFESYPTVISDPQWEMVDLSANGKSDLLLADTNKLTYFPSEGKKGYSAAHIVPSESGFPLIKQGYQQELVTFSNMFGDGHSHRVKITSGSVECWPSLGYGRFGKKVTFANAPSFGEHFDTSQLFLTDVDGSGTTDLAYVYPDRVELFLNQSGNSFSDAVIVRLPELFGVMDQISFTDVLGNGTACLVFTKIAPVPKHYYYNFSGEIKLPDGSFKQSLKPYLLNRIDNNIGSVSYINYCSSTKFILEDKLAGKPWVTKLPFPVHVVEELIHYDLISKSRYVTKYKYHDGYYDPDQKQFLGFGFIESWDTETFEAFQSSYANPDFPVSALNKELFVPPVYTKTWYLNGAPTLEYEKQLAKYKREYFNKDSNAYDFPNSVFSPDIYTSSENTIVQAYNALASKVLRTEVYALDQTPDSANPYAVEESNYNVVLVQPATEEQYAVFMVNQRESISYHYERNPDDPNVQQEFILEVDPLCGETMKSCTVFLPRRNGSTSIYPEQLLLKANASYNNYINTSDADNYRYRGVPYQAQEFEIFGLDLKGKQYCSFDDVSPVIDAIDNPLPYQVAPIPGKLQAQQLTWSKNFFWNEEQDVKKGDKGALKLGEISSRALAHHSETAVFTKKFVSEVFGPSLGDHQAVSKGQPHSLFTRLVYKFKNCLLKIGQKLIPNSLLWRYFNTKTLPAFANGTFEAASTIQCQGGYFFDKVNDYWWNKGLIQYYFDPSQPASFYLPSKTENTFADPTTSLFAKSTVEYDLPYNFSIIKTTQYIDEAHKIENIVPAPIENVVTAQIDYISMQPYQLTDINGNVSQVLFDPLGQVIVTTLFGKENGKPVGGMRLYPYNGQPAEYINHNGAAFDTVLNDSKKYLQGATSYFYYNLLAWKKDQKQPPCSINLIRDDFYHTASGKTAVACKTVINYSDGLGRASESKLKTEPGLAYIRDANGSLTLGSDNKVIQALTDDRWIVSGRTVYNNKGKACEQYLPYFSNTPLFETQDEIADQNLVPPPTVIHYDPLLRIIRIDSPKGFFSKVEFSPWEEKHFDEDDTVIDSVYFINFMDKYPKPPNQPTQAQIDEKDALDKASKFYNTPSTLIFDNVGNPIRTIENNLGSVDQDAFVNIVNGGITSEQLFQELITKGYLVAYGPALVNAWVSDKFQPYTSDFVLDLADPYKQFSNKIINLLKQNCLTSFSTYDIQGRPTIMIDPRLYYSNQTTGTNYYNFKYRYPMGENGAVCVDSIDAGVEKHLNNIFAKQFWLLSPRNYCQLISYDRLQRQSSLQVKELTNGLPIISYADFNVVEVFEYGESPYAPQNNNLRGQLWRTHDLSGVVINSQYSLHGEVLETSRIMASDYKAAITWNCLPPPAQQKWNFLPPPILEAEIFTHGFTYNAIKLLIKETSPDGSVTVNEYNRIGSLNQVKVMFGDKPEQKVIQMIEYNANGQRTSIQYGNGIITNYSYEQTTLHLIGMFSTRLDTPIELIQNSTYTYDPVGNITSSEDKTYEAVFNGNEQIVPRSDYTYNAIYQLIKASGRQHPDIKKDTYKNNKAEGDFKQSKFSKLPNINDDDKLEMYHELYSYDDSNNLICRTHNAASASWTRETPVENNSNRLEEFEYDAAGNLIQLDIINKVPLLFNCFENLIQLGAIEIPNKFNDCDYYMYDSHKQRTRKVSIRTTDGATFSKIEEKVYLGNFEIKKVKDGEGNTILQMQSLKLMDGYSCAVIIHHWIKGAGPNGIVRELRYQLLNDESSVLLEYDENAVRLSYEEYFPYGDTAIIAGSDKEIVELKDYRYTDKECDDSTGLYYYGARYYCTWLGRWLNPDPSGPHHDLNLYVYVTDDPTTYIDPTGETRAQLEAELGKLAVQVLVNQMNIAYALVPSSSATKIDKIADLMAAEIPGSGLDFTKKTEAAFIKTWDNLSILNFHSNPVLKDLWTDSLAKVQNPETLHQKALYSKARGHFTGLITSQYPEFNYHGFAKPPEIHHAEYKSLTPELAVDPANLWLFTRGGKTALGQHEMFHRLSSAKAKSLYTILPGKSRRALGRHRQALKTIGRAKGRKSLESRSKLQYSRRIKGAGVGKHKYSR